MGRACDYVVMRVHDDSYRLDRLTPTRPHAVALITRFRDRRGSPLGWRLSMQGSKRPIWPALAETFASTRRLTNKEAQTAIARATAGVHSYPTETT